MSRRLNGHRPFQATLGFHEAPLLGESRRRTVAPAWRTATLVLAGLWIALAASLLV